MSAAAATGLQLAHSRGLRTVLCCVCRVPCTSRNCWRVQINAYTRVVAVLLDTRYQSRRSHQSLLRHIGRLPSLQQPRSTLTVESFALPPMSTAQYLPQDLSEKDHVSDSDQTVTDIADPSSTAVPPSSTTAYPALHDQHHYAIPHDAAYHAAHPDVEKGDPRELTNAISRRRTDRIYIEWEENDPEDPFNWSRTRKWVVTVVANLMTFMVAFNAGAYTPGQAGMEETFGVSRVAIICGLTVYALGFGVAPLVLAPLSEVYGRNPVYIVSFLIYTVFFIECALSQNLATMLVGRFIQGCAGSTGSTMVGGTLADIWHSDERGTPMSMFATVAMVSTSLGPLVAGYINDGLGWRWIHWIQMIVCGVCCIVFVLVLRESRGSVLLSKRAKKMRKETGDQRIRAPADDERASLAVLVKVSLTRPLWLLISEPVVFSFSLWLAFVWGILYLFLESIPLTFQTVHGFSTSSVSLVFLAMTIGVLIGAVLDFTVQQPLYLKSAQRSETGQPIPESRLYSSCVGSLILTGGMFMYGWSSREGVHWIVPTIAVAMVGFGLYTIYLCVFNYLSDIYGRYASSALAAQSFLRNMFGAGFPLFTVQMFNKLGFAWASSLLGFIALALSAVPFVLMKWGPEIRRRSKFASNLE
ncbi:hypothetical protein G7K_6339-t1 [Saitoella complicata NRRL Y-17804]|uniref:Major facilitator superfamily (MFS) profile domain-containing protein n=1 Tax=Saitoella complicata (strain BCRC 22490 / CBS 7301 / JCM 7358 / NBRC 10748 / NRRL Y-17804) TaxID=698492 RepID=A0A0E9NR29_SAICN|nr:hypothetical protein G7K_6339-t1 [Saitoella complicata NRRL Y-17804]